VEPKIEILIAGCSECTVRSMLKGINGFAVAQLRDSMLWKILDDPDLMFVEEVGMLLREFCLQYCNNSDTLIG